jgi:hypothetical protein
MFLKDGALTGAVAKGGNGGGEVEEGAGYEEEGECGEHDGMRLE